jgi:hypothetical protein
VTLLIHGLGSSETTVNSVAKVEHKTSRNTLFLNLVLSLCGAFHCIIDIGLYQYVVEYKVLCEFGTVCDFDCRSQEKTVARNNIKWRSKFPPFLRFYKYGWGKLYWFYCHISSTHSIETPTMTGMMTMVSLESTSMATSS